MVSNRRRVLADRRPSLPDMKPVTIACRKEGSAVDDGDRLEEVLDRTNMRLTIRESEFENRRLQVPSSPLHVPNDINPPVRSRGMGKRASCA